MRIACRLLAVAALVLWLSPPGVAQRPPRGASGGQRDPTPAPSAGTVTIGALLPLSGPSAWFGKEMRQGMELAVADLKALFSGKAAPDTTAGSDKRAAPEKTADPEKTTIKKIPDPTRTTVPESTLKAPTPKASTKQESAGPARGQDEPREAESGPPVMAELVSGPGIQLTLETRDVATLDTREALAKFHEVATASIPVVLAASPTPTLAIYPAAASRDVLVVHLGHVTGRLPQSSRTLVHTRPPVAVRAEALVGYARGRGAARLAVLAGGDEFGKAVRAAVAARWRAWGLALVQDESVSVEAPDLGERLRRLVRLAPDALLLGFEGPDLGDIARQAREAGYPGFILALDNDPALALAAGPALEPVVILAEAFVAEPDTRAARFAEAYRKKYGTPPSRWAAQAYEAVAMIAEGLRAARQAGGDPVGGTRLREALAARGSFPSLTGGRVVLRGDGTVERPLALFTASGGRLTFVRYVEPAGGAAPTSRP